MPAKVRRIGKPIDDGTPQAGRPTEDLPTWLAALNCQQPESASVKSKTQNPPVTDKPLAEPAALKPPALKPPALPARKPKQTSKIPEPAAKDLKEKDDSDEQLWLFGWVSRQNLIGFGVSLTLHASVLTILACILVATGATTHDAMNIFGVLGDSDEVGSELILDTRLSADSGESGPMEITESSSSLDPSDPGAEIGPSVRWGSGGKGNGTGDSGDGISMGVPTLRVPGHAQTKGNFSAWTSPRDPSPDERYEIVIQIRLPRDVKKYRASDLSTSVIGTDGYRQKNRFKSSDQFTVEDGIVEIRIGVPGGQERVEDTIEVISKMLHEKQTFKIKF